MTSEIGLAGRWVTLRPITPDDYGFIYDLTMEQAARGRWRYYGVTPSPEKFSQSLWAEVVSQYIVCLRTDETRVGVTTAYRGDMRNGTIWMAALFSDAHGAASLEGASLFVRFLFESMPIRKIYCEVPELVESDIQSSFRRLAVEEGRLTNHQYWKGRYWDWIYLAITRERWDRYYQSRQRAHGVGPADVAAQPEAKSL